MPSTTHVLLLNSNKSRTNRGDADKDQTITASEKFYFIFVQDVLDENKVKFLRLPCGATQTQSKRLRLLAWTKFRKTGMLFYLDALSQKLTLEAEHMQIGTYDRKGKPV